jgi:hypothetical protein
MTITSTLSYIGLYPEGGLLRPLATILRWKELGPGKMFIVSMGDWLRNPLVYSGISLEY